MKIQPEFNIAAIISKISAADLSSNQGSGEMPPFATLFEAALQDIDDPQIAATLATLNESGINVPDSIKNNVSGHKGHTASDEQFFDDDNLAQPEFRTVQLINGRSVITSPVNDSDLQKFVSTTEFLSRATDDQALPRQVSALSAIDTQRPSGTPTLYETVGQRSAVEAITLRDHQPPGTFGMLKVSDNGERPERLDTQSRLDIRLPNATAPVTQAPASPAPASQAPGSQPPANLVRSEASAPVALSSIDAETKALKPDVNPTFSPIQASSARSDRTSFRIQQPGMTDSEPGEKTDGPVQGPGLTREHTPQMMRAPVMAATLADLTTPRPAPVTNNSTSTLPDMSPLTSSAPAPAAGTLTTPQSEPATQASRVAERWMHIDDLGKQFNSMIKRAILDTSRNGVSSLRIMLYPENMGSVQAEVIERNQSVTINLLVQNDEVVRLLRDHSQSLRDALGNNNLVDINIQKDKEGSDGRMMQEGTSSNGNQQAMSANVDDNPDGNSDTGSRSTANPNALDTYV